MTHTRESIRAKFRELSNLWIRAYELQHGLPAGRRQGDSLHADALVLENELVALCSPDNEKVT